MNSVDIIIPVYNEEDTIESILEILDNTDFCSLKKNIIIVDDFSCDSTREILKKYENKYKIIFKEKNEGKGSAVSYGIKNSTGDIVVIQDADLEYDPKDYEKLIRVILNDDVDVVYGSRFISNPMKNFMLASYFANRFLTFLTNVIYGTKLTDMETCYKAMKREFIKDINIKSKKFELEPELTAKLIKKGAKIHEVPIDYTARGYCTGKKITCLDGLIAIWALIKYRFVD